MRVLALLALALLLVLPAAAQEMTDALSAALEKPPATGLLVIQVVPETQAAQAGVEVGDVLVSYDDKAAGSIEELNELKAGAAGRESVPMVLVRGDEEIVVELSPGQIGVHLVPVTKGVAVETMPPATDVRFDFSALDQAPREGWYTFHLGPQKAGFEYFKLSKKLGKLLLHREVAFDGGDTWGLNHFDVYEIVQASPRPYALATRLTFPLTGATSSGRMTRTGNGWSWTATLPPTSPELAAPTISHKENGEPADIIPAYLVEALAAFMPREEGACYHYRPLEMGGIGNVSALYCAGSEMIAHGEELFEVWRIENRTFPGRVASTFWVDETGRVVRSDYGGATAELTTKEKALAGLNPGIKPRSR